MLVRNLRTLKMVYWVNVSESSVAGLSGLSHINGHQIVVVVPVDILYMATLSVGMYVKVRKYKILYSCETTIMSSCHF